MDIASEVISNSLMCTNYLNTLYMLGAYCNDPKFLDRYAWANSADPDQTAPRGAV